MLKGHVFSKQLFEHPIFALFINTFLNGANGVSDNYKNGMAVTYSGSNITVDSGAVIIQGRPVEEDTSTTIPVGTENMYCKLVIEIDLDQQNTESELNQVSYKIIKSVNSYPTLTQNNIVKNNAGVYQYELARFRTSANGISDFQDMRTFLDFESIYDEIRQHIQDIDDGSAFVNKGDIAVLTGNITGTGNDSRISTNVNYPTGYNKNNCVVIAKMLQNPNSSQATIATGSFFDSSDSLNGSIQMRVRLMDNQIQIGAKWIMVSEPSYVNTPAIESTTTYNYKIVLMKIS